MNTLIFPNDESANVTAEFYIETRAVLIQTKGMQVGQSFIVEYYFGDDDCYGTWEPFRWCCGQMEMKAPTNQLVIPALPGRYRLVAVESDPDGQVLPFDPIIWDEVKVQYVKMDTYADTSDFVQACC